MEPDEPEPDADVGVGVKPIGPDSVVEAAAAEDAEDTLDNDAELAKLK